METQRLRRYLRHGLMPQLAAFDAVMRLGSVTQASQALHMAQPTVSGHLRKLSDAVGVPLFHCDGRRMLPTAPARALHEGTRDLFADAARHRMCARAVARVRAAALRSEFTASCRAARPRRTPQRSLICSIETPCLPAKHQAAQRWWPDRTHNTCSVLQGMLRIEPRRE